MKIDDILTETTSYADFQHLSTNDYQDSESYPKPGIPVSIQVMGKEIVFAFKSTPELRAKSFVKSFADKHSIPYSEIKAWQSGEYEDDWVDASLRL